MTLPNTTASAAAHKPTHDEIAHCARELWTESGRPFHRDDEIWLEAERRLITASLAPMPAPTIQHRAGRPRSYARGVHGALLRLDAILHR